jgi:hypothetical protein
MNSETHVDGILGTCQLLLIERSKVGTQMRLKTIQTVVALLLIAIGWVAGRTQATPPPEFTLAIDAPLGRTLVKCVRGCILQGGRDEGNPDNKPISSYWYECRGASPPRCGATVNGWLKH